VWFYENLLRIFAMVKGAYAEVLAEEVVDLLAQKG
jgi:hypothetical protein